MTHISIRSGRLFAFVDASNLWSVQKAKRKLFDFNKLQAFLMSFFKASEAKVFYYTAYPAEGTRDYSLEKRHKFFVYLKTALGFIVRKKKLKRIVVKTALGIEIQEKGNMDVELTIDVLHNINSYDIAVLFTGDSDFVELVTYLKQAKKKVYIFSSKDSISKELRTAGHGYIDILDITDDIWGVDLRVRDVK